MFRSKHGTGRLLTRGNTDVKTTGWTSACKCLRTNNAGADTTSLPFHQALGVTDRQSLQWTKTQMTLCYPWWTRGSACKSNSMVDVIRSTTMKPGEVQHGGQKGGKVGLGFVAMPCLALSLAELAEEGRQLHKGT